MYRFKKMSKYTDVYIGYIDNNYTFIKRKKKCIDNVLLNRIYTFFKDYCIIQYVSIDQFHNCKLCDKIYTNIEYVYYDGLTRYIFPDYLYHYIKTHDIEIDEKLINLIKIINKLDYI
jgi:hypothetical protein